MKKNKPIPKFKDLAKEREFWQKADSTEFIDWSEVKPVVFPNLQPSTKTISLRLPESLYSRIKNEAHKRDVPYQSLIKLILDRVV